MSMTITRNDSFRFQTDKPNGLRVCVVSSCSQDKHVITHDFEDGIINFIDHHTPTIDFDLYGHIDAPRAEDDDKAIRMYDSNLKHTNELHYEDNPNIPHRHILYKDKEDMLLAFKKDFPEQEKIMCDIFEKQFSFKEKVKKFLQKYISCLSK